MAAGDDQLVNAKLVSTSRVGGLAGPAQPPHQDHGARTWPAANTDEGWTEVTRKRRRPRNQHAPVPPRRVQVEAQATGKGRGGNKADGKCSRNQSKSAGKGRSDDITLTPDNWLPRAADWTGNPPVVTTFLNLWRLKRSRM